jgi:PAS domain S-box-containing protein
MPVVEFSRGAELLFAAKAGDVIGRPTHLTELELHGELIANHLRHPASRGTAPEADLLLERADGSVFPGHIRAYPIPNEDGVISGSVLVVSDLSERKNLEAQLQQSHKMDAIGQLAGGIAHDFNNMIAGIMGLAELSLMQEDLPPMAQSSLKRIVTTSERASELTKQ